MRRAFAALAAVLLVTPASAQQVCADRDALIEQLRAGYGEELSAGGLQSEDAMVEVWHSSEDGTWTILLTRADGISCILAAGTDWLEALPGEQASGMKG